MLQKAQTAKEEQNEAKELEIIKLAVSSAQVAGKGILTRDNLYTELSKLKNIEELAESDLGFYYRGNKNYRIYKDGRIEENLLPIEYQQVEYIESTGTQYIKTKLKSSNEIFEYIASVSSKANSQTNQQALFGSTNGFNVSIVSKLYRATKQCITDIMINEDKFDLIDFVSDPKQSKVSLKINEYRQTGTYSSFILGNSIGVFGYGDGNAKSCYRLKSLKILINDKLEIDFIPCYSMTTTTDVDGIKRPKDTIGLYDTVEGKFYTNQGTGEFIAGPEV